ncbi:hypothetical protein FOH24_13795 [Acetobacter tropicalis]|nr:hypothetical protein [Acetobacter tropicalis]KAA8387342.1 hypothetical protein FOH24_13795 [Acetobacter tropicalis]KAA8387545.1 hypothetical protein FOH22_09500 [Acetobacter tropicalis]MBC9010119.1 hypothetical protein [Acetobacter tropicalis]MDO8170946.1 hypothetical protein [Acetobacter tropicalis]
MSKKQKEALEALEDAYKDTIKLIKNAKPDDQVALLSTAAIVNPSGFSSAGMHTLGTFNALITAAGQSLVQVVMMAPDDERDRVLFRVMVIIAETVRRKRKGNETPVTSAYIDKVKSLILLPDYSACPDTKLH